MRFFISGPYTASHPREVLKNVNAAIDAGIQLMARGHHVYVPHFTHYMHLRPQCTFEYEEYLRNDLAWLEVSEAVLFLAHSKGADGELEKAKELGLKIYYSIKDVLPCKES
jgi:hypothetical protein